MPPIKPKLVNRGTAGLLSKQPAKPANGESHKPGEPAPRPKTFNKIAPALKPHIVPIDSLTPDPNNARLHPDRNLESIMDSLAFYGQVKPVVVRDQTGVVMAGNGTMAAAKAMGWTKLAAIRVPMTDAEAAGYGLADNRTAELARWDFEVVARLDRLISEAGGQNVGWSLEELTALRMTDFTKPIGTAHEDGLDTLPEADKLLDKWKVKLGQEWSIPSASGKMQHRIICGDSTDRKLVARSVRDGKATCVFADPPYGVAIGDKNKMLNTFQRAGRCLKNLDNDTQTPTELRAHLTSVFRNVREVAMSDSCSVLVTSPQGGELSMMMLMMMVDAGLPVRHVLIWKKNSPTFSMGRLDYDYQHEPILFTWGKRHKKKQEGQFKTSVWDIDKPRASPEHPTMKPVELVVNAILNHTDVGDVVFDPFLGSGSSLVAAEQTQRRGVGIEISPAYCSVSLERLERIGLRPTKVE